jgi:membrane-associated phospholipid phosphatase
MARITDGAADASKVEEVDIAIVAAATDRKHHPVARAVGAVGHVGDQPPLLAVSAAVLAGGWLFGSRRAMRAGARMLLAEAASIVLKDLTKRVISRTRPDVLFEDGRYELRTGGPHDGPYNSFPSGHTAGAVAVSRALAREYPRLALPGYGFAAAVAAGQLPESNHYPTDIAAGLAVGIASDLVADALFTAIEGRSER